VASKTNLVTAQLSDTVETVLAKLNFHNIISLPLLNEAAQFVGIVSLQDIVLDMVWRPEERAQTAHVLSRQIRDVFVLREEAKHLWVFQATDTLATIIETFSNGVHRALVTQKDDSNRHSHYVMLSQSDVVKFLSQNLTSFKDVSAKTLAQLKIGEKRTETITADIRTFDAFKILGDEYVTGLPIVEKETGRLLANLSASDLRGLNVQKLMFLNESVESFLTAQKGGIRAPITCKSSTPFDQVIQTLVENNVHRVWLVDDKEKPIGVVTLTDILNVFKNVKFTPSAPLS
jgi:CBS domain-containing protein